MKIQILNQAKKKKFVAGLTNLGIKKIPQLLIRSGKERIRAYSGNLNTEQIMDIWKILPIEGVGLYIGKDMINRNGVHEIRLSLDGMHTWKEQLTERIFILTEKQEEDWFLGKDIDLAEEQTAKIEEGFVSVKSSDEKDFIGIGKIGSDKKTLFSFLPKERRRKEQMS
jgi:NOL1/NOP2/fmu family ribosome biogenesis protein